MKFLMRVSLMTLSYHFMELFVAILLTSVFFMIKNLVSKKESRRETIVFLSLLSLFGLYKASPEFLCTLLAYAVICSLSLLVTVKFLSFANKNSAKGLIK